MVDHEVTTEEKFSIPEKKYIPSQHLHFNRQNSTGEVSKELLKKRKAAAKERLRGSLIYGTKSKSTENVDNENNHEKYSKIINELLTRSPKEYERTITIKEIRTLENAYKSVMEKFLYKMDKFLRSTKELRNVLLKTLKEFRVVSRSTAQVTVAASVMHLALVMGGLVQKILHFSWNPRISMLSTVVASLSFATSFLSLTYMRRTTSEISKDMRKEGRFLLDLTIAHRKGDWIDEAVSRLFPYGISLDLIDKKALEDRSCFENKDSWRKYLCSIILLSNMEKDAKLPNDDRFLTAIKLFVENPVSEIWWSRIKIKKLLKEVRKKADNISVKDFISGHEDHIRRTALYLYPVLIPLLVCSWNTEEMRFICTSIAGVLAVLDLGNDEKQEVEDLKRIAQSFEKDFKEIDKICEVLDSSDD